MMVPLIVIAPSGLVLLVFCVWLMWRNQQLKGQLNEVLEHYQDRRFTGSKRLGRTYGWRCRQCTAAALLCLDTAYARGWKLDRSPRDALCPTCGREAADDVAS